MAEDFDSITVALAARFAPGLVTPPVGYTNVRVSTGNLPQKITVLPAVLVFPVNGVFETSGGDRQGLHEFAVRFYYSMGLDIARDMVALRKWLTVLSDQLRGAVQLGGTAAVDYARVDAWTIGKMAYANDEFNGIELTVHIHTSIGWAATG